MNLIGDWHHFQATLNRRMEQLALERPIWNPPMIGIVFAPAHIPVTRKILWSSLEYWHFRSGDRFDFFWPGYAVNWNGDGKRINRLPRSVSAAFFAPFDNFGSPQEIRFSNQTFVEFTDEFITRSTQGPMDPHFCYFPPSVSGQIRLWSDQHHYRYSGGLDLVLLSPRYDGNRRWTSIDYSTCVVIHLLKLANVGVSISELFEAISHFADLTEDERLPLELLDQLQFDPSQPDASRTRLVSIRSLFEIGVGLADIASFAMQFRH